MQLFLYGVGITMLYIIVAVGIMLLARKYLTIPDELFRKILHFILLGAYIPLVFAFETWWMAAIFAISLIIILFPALSVAGKIPMFSFFMNERKKGEFKSSMVLAVGMMAFSVCICWGMFGEKYLVLATIYAWGIAFIAKITFGVILVNLNEQSFQFCDSAFIAFKLLAACLQFFCRLQPELLFHYEDEMLTVFENIPHD